MRHFYECMLAICLSLFPSRGSMMRNLNSEYKTDQTDFTDWICFVTSNLMEKISLDP